MPEKITRLLKVEELAMLGLAIYLNTFLPFEWWWYLVFFFLPDIGMIGYLVNARVGALTYNFVHHKGIALLVYIIGLARQSPEAQFAGLVLFGHSSFDRILGYGLKFDTGFHHTHLGRIGRTANGN